jgi:TolB-like protein
MRKLLCIFGLFMVLLSGTLSAQQMNLDTTLTRAARGVEEVLSQGTKVAVLNFSSPSETFSDHVIEELTGKLVIGRKITIVDRRNLALITSEMHLQLSGDVSDESAQAIGRMLGAQSIVSGSLTNMGTFYRFRIRVINVETAAIQTQVSLDLQNDSQVAFLLGSSLSSGSTPANTTQSSVPQEAANHGSGNTNPNTLTVNQFTNSSFDSRIQDRMFFIPVINGTRYHVWLYDSAGNNSMIDAIFTAQYEDGTAIFSNVDTAWPNQQQFTANRNGMVVLTISPYSRGRTGDFSLLFNTTGIRLSRASTVPMEVNRFANSSFDSQIQDLTFTFSVINGTRYHAWLYDSAGNNSMIDAVFTAQYEDGTNIFTNVDTAWPDQQQFTANRNGMVVLSISPYSRGRTGDFSVVFNTNGIRPIPQW